MIGPVAALLLLAGAAFAQPAPGQAAAGQATPGIAAHGGPVRALAVGGLGAASGGLDQAVIFWAPDGRPLVVARWHQGAVESLIAIPVIGAAGGGAGFASGGEDGRIGIWPAAGATAPDMVLTGHAGPVTALASDGTALASGGFDATVRVWDGQGGVQVFEAHRGAVTALAYTPQGLVSAGQDGTLRAWPGGDIMAEYGVPILALAAWPGGVAVAGADGILRLPGRQIATGPRPVVALAVHGGILAASGGGDVGLWDLASGRLLRVLEGPGLPVWSLGFGPDGTLWTGGADAQIRRWNPATGHPLSESPGIRPAIPEGADPDGARVFRACQACHALADDAGAMAGPSLHGIFGRRMGSLAGYAYSPRLAQGDIIWNAETLADLFTRGPDIVTPGTRMPVQRLADAEDLAALLRFLAVATR